jgi:hypothetical protein
MSSRNVRAVVAAVVIVLAGSGPASASGQKGSKQFDPFKVQTRRTAPPAKRVFEPTELPPPGLTTRLASCESQSSAFGASPRTTPCPYLVGELKLTGVFEGDRMSAVVLVQPTNESIILQVGDVLYDGRVTSITEATADAEATLVLTQVKRFRAKGGVRTNESKVTLRLAS